MYVILVAMEKEAQYIKCPNAKVIVTGIGRHNVIKTLCKAIIHRKVSEHDTFINMLLINQQLMYSLNCKPY